MSGLIPHSVFEAAGTGPTLVGVSGGGDSLALLAMACEDVLRRPVVAGIVDHGLSPGSEAVAAQAAETARGLGAHVLRVRLQPPPSASVSQGWARMARHQALCAMAHAAGAQAIFLAHTADDQAEGVLIAREREGSWRAGGGMAALSPSPVWPAGRGLLVARPLLAWRRASLRAFLRQRAAPWFDDPANESPRFLRARARAMLAGQGDLSARLAAFAARLRTRQDKLDRAALTLLAAHGVFEEGGCVLGAIPDESAAWRRALGAVLMCVAGAAAAASPQAVARLVARLRFGGQTKATLGGCVIQARARAWDVLRDPGAVLGRAGKARLCDMALTAGQTLIWDGRLAVSVAEEGWRLRPWGSGTDPTRPMLVKGCKAVALGDAPTVRSAWLARERAFALLGATLTEE